MGENTNSYINKVFLIQKRAAKIILNRPIRTPTLDLFHELKWLTFNYRVKYHTAIMVYKYQNNMTPTYMNDILSFSKNEYHDLRSNTNKDLVLRNIPRTNYLKDSFSYFSIKVWNNIPANIKHCKTLQSFKKNCKIHFIKEQFEI